MYNCVSQVTYFHNSRYERRIQLNEDFQGMVAGKYDPIHSLPCLCQMYPDVEILHEEDSFHPSRQKGGCPASGARWIMCGKRLYLLLVGRGVIYNSNPCVLMECYISGEAETRLSRET